MIVPDANLLLYACDSSSPFHARASSWWRQCLSGREPVGFTHPVLFAFVRISTSARVYAQPLTVAEAATHVRSWLARSVSRVLLPEADHAEQVLALLDAAGGVGGNLVTDAQIAALAIAYKGQVHTADGDFQRFPNLDCHYPLKDPA